MSQPQNGPEKRDANDVLREDGTDELRRQFDFNRKVVPLEGAPGASRQECQTARSTPAWNWHDYSITAAALQDQRFPEIRWMLTDLLPEGLTLLAGRPKVGKSWLALDIALGVGDGGSVMGSIRPASTGDVLVLALEDNPRRLQKRCHKLRGACMDPWPERVTLVELAKRPLVSCR